MIEKGFLDKNLSMKRVSRSRVRRTAPHAKDSHFFQKKEAGEQSFFNSHGSHDVFFSAAIPRANSVVQPKYESGKPADPLLHRESKEKEEDKKLKRQQLATDNTTSRATTPVYINSLPGSGQALPKQEQAFFAHRMGHDFDEVKIHTGAEAATSAQEVNAKAYTYGNHIVFNQGQYNFSTTEGKELLAHELAHVVQNDQKIKRRVTPRYSEITTNLTTGWTDWEITDTEEYNIMDILIPLNRFDFYDTVMQMQRDGNLAKFLSELPSGARASFSLISLMERIRDHRMTHEEQVQYQRSVAWVTNGTEALEALTILNATYTDRQEILSSISNAEFDRFLTLVPETTDQTILRRIQDFTILHNGFNIAQLGSFQRLFMVARAAAAGQTLEQYLAGQTNSRGYGGATPSRWNHMPATQRAAWQHRFLVIYAQLQTASIPQIRAMITNAIAHGGGIRFNEEACEMNGAFAYSNGTNWLTVGIDFVRAAEANLTYVYANISHEIGHDEYENTQLDAVMNQATTPAERSAAAASGNSLHSAYGYLETEIYGELREHRYWIPGHNPTDDPDVDIEAKLRQIALAVAPTVARPLLLAFRNRISRDANILPAARTLFDTKLRLVFPGFI